MEEFRGIHISAEISTNKTTHYHTVRSLADLAPFVAWWNEHAKQLDLPELPLSEPPRP